MRMLKNWRPYLIHFFIEKNDLIRNELDGANVPPSYKVYNGERFDCFESVSIDFVQKIITESPKSFCELDPLLAALFFECLVTLLPYYTYFINDSLSSAEVGNTAGTTGNPEYG